MLVDIFLLKYKNYYNRYADKIETVDDAYNYICRDGSKEALFSNINFVPNDSVETTQIVNWNGESPDYLLVVLNNQIRSRWYVMEQTRTLGGQYLLTLRRDLLADYLDQIRYSTMFIEKGYVKNTNPLIFNDEDMAFNQIKTSETILKGRSNCSWIVGYLDSSYDADSQINIKLDPSLQAYNTTEYSTTEAFLNAYNNKIKPIDFQWEFSVGYSRQVVGTAYIGSKCIFYNNSEKNNITNLGNTIPSLQYYLTVPAGGLTELSVANSVSIIASDILLNTSI